MSTELVQRFLLEVSRQRVFIEILCGTTQFGALSRVEAE